MKVKITDVFRSLGQPTVTYVRRDAGRYERLLSGALDVKGQLCLLTGPSKTGKTTLYKKVLEEKKLLPLTVRCDGQLSHEEFWRRALEGLHFDRIKEHNSETESEVSSTGKILGHIGWKWLASLSGEVSVGIKSARSDGEVRERILANPSPYHLIPALKSLPITLVIEDFHYLTPDVQKVVFQQWKAFTDDEVSVIVIGTTHHAIDIATANQDLLGRLSQIDVAQWSGDDLQNILKQGFGYLGCDPINHLGLRQIMTEIAKESVGLPIITQQVAEQIFHNLEINEVETLEFTKTVVPKIDEALIYSTLADVANLKYSQLQNDYLQLTTGPRKRARRYNTYELALACFKLEPLRFSLMRHQIEERLRQLPVPEDQIPPPASIGSMLKALTEFQRNRGIELLEWRPNERTLYILEPAFLFYLRWREGRVPQRSPPDLTARIGAVSLEIKALLAQLNVIQIKESGDVQAVTVVGAENLGGSERNKSG